MVNANNPDGYSSDMTNLGSKVGEKTESTLCLQSESGDLLFPHFKGPVFSGRRYY